MAISSAPSNGLSCHDHCHICTNDSGIQRRIASICGGDQRSSPRMISSSMWMKYEIQKQPLSSSSLWTGIHEIALIGKPTSERLGWSVVRGASLRMMAWENNANPFDT